MKPLGQFLASVPYQVQNIGYGDDSIGNTVQEMKKHIIMASRNPFVREFAREILGAVSPYDKWGEAEAVYRFVRDNVRYTRDPLGWEYVQTPPHLLEGVRQYQEGTAAKPIGDCDDMTTLGLTLLRSIGFSTAIKVVSFRPDKKYQHVYGLVNVEGDWTPFDAIRPYWNFGQTADMVPTRFFEEKV